MLRWVNYSVICGRVLRHSYHHRLNVSMELNIFPHQHRKAQVWTGGGTVSAWPLMGSLICAWSRWDAVHCFRKVITAVTDDSGSNPTMETFTGTNMAQDNWASCNYRVDDMYMKQNFNQITLCMWKLVYRTLFWPNLEANMTSIWFERIYSVIMAVKCVCVF